MKTIGMMMVEISKELGEDEELYFPTRIEYLDDCVYILVSRTGCRPGNRETWWIGVENPAPGATDVVVRLADKDEIEFID